jgi:glycosyltransferase involved in cell wall biosynthesis
MRTRPLVMRIITRLAGGGPPVHAALLNRGIGRHGFDSVLVFGECGPGETDMSYLLRDGDAVERVPSLVPSLSPWRDFLAFLAIFRLVRRYRPDIVHTHTAKAGLLGRIAATLAGCRCIVHTYHGHVLAGYFPSHINRMIQKLEQWLGRLSLALCTVSPQQVRELTEQFAVADERKFRVIPLGIELDRFAGVPVPDFNSPRLTVAWLGRFVPIKNLPLLLKVASICQQRGLAVEFLAAGEGVLRREIEAQASEKRLANVEFLPWQEDVLPVLLRSHLLILTSHREGTPLALIQGMAAGRPFLSTPAGGVVDLGAGVPKLEQDAWWYENGTLCRAEAAAFVDALERVLADRAVLWRQSESARAFAQRNFSDARLSGDMAHLYRELLAPAGIAEKSPLEAS